MRRISLFIACYTVFVAANSLFAEIDVDFNRDIRPILSRHCFACHGPDKEAREAELRLDTAQGATADLGDYRAVEAGNPAQSELIARIESDDPDVVMPPPESGHKLTAEEKKSLRWWIAAGATYDIHWSFTPPIKASLPPIKNNDWPRHALDYFVLSSLEVKGLQPSATADRYQWIRRVSLDLTGLPPTPEEADDFVADASEQAFETVVSRLLNSQAYGEHWARMWLDLARYADTKGYEKDRPRDMWRFRDWVIDAFNADMPYDQFTSEQLAGDLLANPTTDQYLATAFHRNTMTNEEGGTDDEEFRVAAVKDRVDTTMQVWMGLTMGCAKCHSHKFDPIRMNDYYSFYALFNQTQDSDRGDESPTMATPTPEQSRRIAELEAAVTETQRALDAASAGVQEAFVTWRKQFAGESVWQPLQMTSFRSKHDVKLSQQDDATLVAAGARPEKDEWTLKLELPASGKITSLRIDALNNATAGGEWPDHNIVLSEVLVYVIEPKREPRRVKLTNARADFSQDKWHVTKAIDGSDTTGWAFAPQTGESHAAVFDFETPIDVPNNAQLQLTLRQNHGQQHLLARLRVSTSSIEPRFLTADVDAEVGLRKAFELHEFPATGDLLGRLDREKKSLRDMRGRIVKTPVMRELVSDKQRTTRIHQRGSFLDQGEVVQPQVPTLFGQLPENASMDRRGVAQWIMQPENPLTARVMVNRVWARLFGAGIVETEEDFGSQGTPPLHPELLDWLAVDFREHGWSIKQLLRSIVLSSTYRQSATITQARLAADPRNRFFSRGPRFRLSAETIRDQALAVSGLLARKLGGPSVMPPQPAGIWRSTYSGLKWQNASGPDRYRRGLYTYWKRTSPYPAMLTFDAGSGEICQIRRVRTNTPLQALVTLNDPAFVEAAGALSLQMTNKGGGLKQKLTRGFRLVLTRPPRDRELTRLESFYKSIKAEFVEDKAAAEQLVKAAGLESGDAAMVAVANVLLNLDETLMK